MRAAFKRMTEHLNEPDFMTRFHASATLFWIAMIPPSLLWLSESILWVVLMSVWANIAGHWSGFQAVHGERDNDRQMAELKEEIAELKELLLEHVQAWDGPIHGIEFRKE
jgi:hypothetical protein